MWKFSLARTGGIKVGEGRLNGALEGRKALVSRLDRVVSGAIQYSTKIRDLLAGEIDVDVRWVGSAAGRMDG
jgi:hypothetical protein